MEAHKASSGSKKKKKPTNTGQGTVKNDSTRKGELELRIRKRVALEERAFRIIERLLDNPITEDFLIDAAKFIDPNHYKDVVEERSIINHCGYPVCGNKLKNVPKQKYHICMKSQKVYDITDRKMFCSGQCYQSSEYYRKQLSSSPVWMREGENIKPFQLLSPQHVRGMEGEVVLVHPSLPVKMEVDLAEKVWLPRSDLSRQSEKNNSDLTDSTAKLHNISIDDVSRPASDSKQNTKRRDIVDANKQPSFSQKQANRPLTIDTDRANRPFMVDIEHNDRPHAVAEEHAEYQRSVSQEQANKPLTVNTEQANKPLTVNTEKANQPLTVNTEQANQPLTVNTEQANQPLTVSTDHENTPLAIPSQLQHANNQASVTKEDRNRQLLVTEEPSNRPRTVIQKHGNNLDKVTEHHGSKQPSVAQQSSDLGIKFPYAYTKDDEITSRECRELSNLTEGERNEPAIGTCRVKSTNEKITDILEKRLKKKKVPTATLR